MSPIARKHRWPLLLAALLMSAYLLVYSNEPGAIDGEATLAVAANLIRTGQPDIGVLGAADGLLPEMARMGSFGVDGRLYAKKGVTPSLVMLPLVVLGHLIPLLPVRATAMLFNGIITTLTALLLYAGARQLGYRPVVGFGLGLIYGLATFALAYTSTLFGEPLAGFLLLVAVLTGHMYRQKGRTSWLLICGTALGLTWGINLSYGLLTPLVVVYVFGLSPLRWKWRTVITLAAPLALMGLALLAYNMARFGGPLESGYQFAEGEGFTYPIGIGLFGMVLSPYRGALWYNPILLLIVPGIGLWWHQRRRLLAIIGAVSAVHLLTYAGWWSWHGGIVWGPRFVLPLLPLWCLLLLPVLDRAVKHRALKIGVVALVMLSFGVQLLGTLLDYTPYTAYLYENYGTGVAEGLISGLADEVFYRPDLSPIVGHLRLLLDGQPLAPTLFEQQDSVHALLACLPLAAAALIWRLPRRAATLLILSMLIATSGGIVLRQQHTGHIARLATEQLTPADTLIAATTHYRTDFIDLTAPAYVITTNSPTDPDDALTAGLFDSALAHGGLTWFLTWFPPADTVNWQERHLWQHHAFVRQISFDDHRALLFNVGTTLSADTPGGWQFGPVTLSRYALQRSAGGLHLTLDWQTAQPVDRNLSWFVHLLGANGQIIQQRDRLPVGGYQPPSQWTDGEIVTDRLFFPLATSRNTGGWQVRIGWVDPATGERIPVSDPEGAPVTDGFILLPLP